MPQPIVTDKVWVSYAAGLGFPQPAQFGKTKTTAVGSPTPDPAWPDIFLADPAALIHPYRNKLASQFYDVVLDASSTPILAPKPQAEVDAILAADQADKDARQAEKEEAVERIRTTPPIPDRDGPNPPPSSVPGLRAWVEQLDDRIRDLERAQMDKSYLP